MFRFRVERTSREDSSRGTDVTVYRDLNPLTDKFISRPGTMDQYPNPARKINSNLRAKVAGTGEDGS